MDELQKYYEYLKNAGADVPPTLESFKKTLSDLGEAQSYYLYLQKNKFDTPATFDSFAETLGILKKKDGGQPSSNLLQTGSLPLGSSSAANLQPTPVPQEVSENPFADKRMFEMISKARPANANEIYNRRAEALTTRDPKLIKESTDELMSLMEEENPVTISLADRQEIARLTGVTDPAKQLQILKARLGETTETGDLTFNVLDPTIGVDISTLPKEDSEKLGALANKLEYFSKAKIDDRWSKGKKTVLTIGGKETTDLEDFLNLGNNPTQAMVAEAKRYGAETLNDSFSTGLESIRETDQVRYERIADAITNNKAIPTTDIVELTSKGAKIISDVTSQKMVDREIDSDTYNRVSDQLATDRSNNIYQHPDFLRSVIADVISKHYEKDGGVLFSKWMVTDKEIDAVPREEFMLAGLVPNHPEFKKQLQILKDKEGWMPFQNAIAKDDLFREFRKGAMSVPEGIVGTVESAIMPDEKLVQDQSTAQFGVSDRANQRGKYFKDNYGTWADAFNGFGQFATQLGAMFAGGSLVGAAGEALGGGTTAARLLNATRLQKLGNALVDNSSMYSQYAVPFVMSYGDYYKDALSKGANPLQAKMMAFTNASMEGVSETIFDNVAFGKQVARELFNKENFDKIAQVFSRGALDETAQQGYKDILLKTIGTVAKSAGAAGKEAFEEVPVALTNFIVDGVANPDLVSNRNVTEEMKDAFVGGLVSFSIPSLLGLGGSLRQQFKENKPAQESLMIAAMQQPQVLESINRMVEKGEISQVEANRRIKVLNTAAEQLKNIPETYEDGEAMTPQDREKYLSLSVKEKVLEDMASGGDRAVKAIAEKQLVDVVAQKESILTKQPVDEERKDTFTVTVEDDTNAEGGMTVNPRSEGEVDIADQPATITTEERQPVASTSLFQRVQSNLTTPKNETEDERLRVENVKSLTEEQILPELKAQSLDAPNAVVNQLNGDKELTTDLIADNSEEDINAAINKWTDAITNETHTPEEADVHISLLEEGLAKKHGTQVVEGEEVFAAQNPQVATAQAATAASGISVIRPVQDRATTQTRGGVTIVSPQPNTVTAPTAPVVIQPADNAQVSETRGGVTVIRPTNEVELFADRIIRGDDLTRDTDQQFYVNNAEAIEAELKRRFVESAGREVPSEFTPEERVRFSDTLFAFADKILKADITGAGGTSAMTNLFKIPQEILGRAIQAVALAIKGKESLVDAIKKGMEVFAAEEDLPQVDEQDFTGLIKSLMAGEKPKAGSAFAKHINVDVEGVVPSDREYLNAIDNPEPRDPIAAYHMTREAEVPKMFGADLRQQELFDSTPSDERFRAQMDMLQDGKSLIAAAQGMFGSTDITVYGPLLFRYIQNMSGNDVGLTNKKAVLLATFLGEIKQAIYNNTNPSDADAIRQLDGKVSSYYNRFMHVTAKNLSAGRLLRLFRDKYMADMFTETILEEDQMEDRANTTAAEAGDVSDEDAVAHEDKPKQKADEKKAKAARSEKKKKEASRKKGSKDDYSRRAKEKEDDIKDKYGSKNNLVNSIIDRIKKINCK